MVWKRTSLLALLTLVPPAALAEDTGLLPVQQLLPAPGGALNFNQLQGAWTPGHLGMAFGLSANYAANPLIYSLGNGSYVPVLERQAQADLTAAIGVGSKLSLGLAMPLAFLQSAGDSNLVPTVPSTALGDLRVVPKMQLLGKEQGLGLALSATVGLPTGDEAAYAGEQSLTIKPELLLELRAGDRLRVAANAGYFWRRPVTQLGLTLGSEVTYGVGAGYALKPDKLQVLGEVFGRVSFDDDEGVTLSTLPLELLVSVRYQPLAGHAVTLGGGPGIVRGYGTPLYRAFLGYSVALGGAPKVPDTDGDGLRDNRDRCPGEREDMDAFQDDDGCPDLDNDNDGLADTADKCPLEAEDKDAFQDEDGCPDPDNDGDGLADAQDKCPLEAENKNGIEDEDGCPEVDSDGDGIVDAKDKCPKKAENKNGIEDEDGCPEEPAPDADKDGIPDAKDKCPKKAENINGFADEDGCPEVDSDNDGLPDYKDKCPKVPENKDGVEDEDGCPEAAKAPEKAPVDTDGDGILDDKDKCPKKAETVNGFQDEDGCPEADADNDGIPDAKDKCPQKPENKDGVEDEDGCPEEAKAPEKAPVDTDGDGIPDAKDKCPKKAETVNGFADEDGCPEVDTDGDGLPDFKDKCPKKPENKDGVEDEDGCPEEAKAPEKAPADQDGDGIPDAKDKCPKKAETVNGVKDEDGCPEADADGDGVIDANDKCPKVPENKDGVQDEDGCPEVDTDGDGLFDHLDECPKKPETKNEYQDDDGCPDEKPVIKVAAKEIEISEKVYFDTGTANLKPRSKQLLTVVAGVLKANPDVDKIRVGGHTDNVGDPQKNLDLSQRRADAVKAYLVEQGVEESRLEAKGFGETRPVTTNSTPEGREKNRRVQFTILSRKPAK